jgi:hypothetical protein
MRLLSIALLSVLFCVTVCFELLLFAAVTYYTWPALVVVVAFALTAWWLATAKPSAPRTSRLPPGVYRIVFDPVSHRVRK